MALGGWKALLGAKMSNPSSKKEHVIVRFVLVQCMFCGQTWPIETKACIMEEVKDLKRLLLQQGARNQTIHSLTPRGQTTKQGCMCNYRKHKQFFKSTLEHPGLQARLRHDLHFIFPHQHLFSSITCLGEWRSCCHWESSLCVTWWRCLPEFWTHQRDKIDLRTESCLWAHSKLNWCSKWYDLDFQANSPHSGRMGQLSMESILFWYVFVWQWVSSAFGKSWPATSWGQCQRHACWLKENLRVVYKVGDALDCTDNPQKIGAIVVNCLQQRLITVKPNFFFCVGKRQNEVNWSGDPNALSGSAGRTCCGVGFSQEVS